MSSPPIIRLAWADALSAYPCRGHHVHVSSIADATPQPPAEEFDAIFTYKVPRLTPDGTCSMGGELEPEPVDLRRVLWPGVDALGVARAARRIAALKAVVLALAKATAAEWVGVYRVVPSPPAAAPRTPDERALVKEAYVGSPSRAFFPLTPEFAAASNNSTVAMTGSVVVIHDVRKLHGDEPYYNCDGHVRAEVCVPIRGPDGTVIGIIDAEAWRPNHFTEERIATILDTAAQLGEASLLGSWMDA